MEIIKDLRQHHLEAFEEAYNKDRPVGLSSAAGHAVRAALTAGWFNGSAESVDVGEMKPAEVRRLSREIDAAYNAAVALDPN